MCSYVIMIEMSRGICIVFISLVIYNMYLLYTRVSRDKFLIKHGFGYLRDVREDLYHYSLLPNLTTHVRSGVAWWLTQVPGHFEGLIKKKV